MHDIVTAQREKVPAIGTREGLGPKLIFKRFFLILGVIVVSALIVLSFLEVALFGRKCERIFSSCKELLSALPTIIGEYMRLGYYWSVCRGISPDACLLYGSMIAHRDTVIRAGAVVGSFTIVGLAEIGENVSIASHVSLISGKYQHGRPRDRTSGGILIEQYDKIRIGKNCWIGQQAVIMANVGDNCTIGAGSVVLKDVPPNSTYMGNPARKVNLEMPGKETPEKIISY